MPQKNVTHEGLDELINSFRRSDGIIQREGRGFLRDLAIWGVTQSQKNILNEGAVFTNELIQGMHYEIDNTHDGLEATILPSKKADEYAWFVEEGSPPHKAPIDALRPWADAHGIPVGAVWWKIATEGTDPRYMFRKTHEELDDKTNRELPGFVDTILRRL